MEPTSERELETTRRKLRDLEDAYAEAEADTDDAHPRDIELASLKRVINQVKEEIARYEAHRAGPCVAARA